VSDGKGGTKTETYQEKVVTCTASENFPFNDVRVVGPVFNVHNFKNSPVWNRWVSVVSFRFFPEVGDAETQAAIDSAVSAMYARMKARDTNASSTWSKDNQYHNYCIYPHDASLNKQQEESRVASVSQRLFAVGLVMCGSGMAFWYLCFVGMFVHNPVLRYVKEFTVKSFENKQIAVINERKPMGGGTFFGWNGGYEEPEFVVRAVEPGYAEAAPGYAEATPGYAEAAPGYAEAAPVYMDAALIVPLGLDNAEKGMIK
jgi:hypothetical protein